MGMFDRLLRRQRRVTEENPTMERPRDERPPALRVGNVQGVGQRERQEDSFAVRNASNAQELERRGLFAVVCDGMGGMEDGKSASEAAIDGFLQLFQAVRILGDTLHFMSVGDSAIFLKRGEGVFQLNEEHTCLNDLYRRELREDVIQKNRAEGDEDARRLTAFVGMQGLEAVDQSLRPWHLKRGDTLLLCSDGISGILSPAELKEAMSLSPDEGCHLLETLVEEKALPAQDNYTGILISYQ